MYKIQKYKCVRFFESFSTCFLVGESQGGGGLCSHPAAADGPIKCFRRPPARHPHQHDDPHLLQHTSHTLHSSSDNFENRLIVSFLSFNPFHSEHQGYYVLDGYKSPYNNTVVHGTGKVITLK